MFTLKYAIYFGREAKVKRIIRERHKIISFYLYVPGSENNGPWRGLVTMKARVPESLFRNFLLEEGWKEERERCYTTRSTELYYRAVIYASLLQCTRRERVPKDLIRKLPYLHLKFWGEIFSSSYSNRGWRRDLYRPVKAFREVYKIGY
ncbi:MAG TPA: hypothetical protein ENF65_00210 [Euryarchaeota archaeon]|nr:hypothetical protein [Euryarchaeota archaeon]